MKYSTYILKIWNSIKNALQQKKVLIPLVLWLLFLPFSANVDISVTNAIYQTSWHKSDYAFYSSSWLHSIAKWGLFPGQFLFGISIICYVITGILKKKIYQKAFLFLAISYFLGSGIFTFGFFKHFWGRPRPLETTYYGGIHSFRPCFMPNFGFHRSNRSFPSGHAVSGFYFLSFYILAKRHKKKLLAHVSLITGLTIGVIFSISRICLGAHYISDVLFGGLIIWISICICDEIIYGTGNRHGEKP